MSLGLGTSLGKPLIGGAPFLPSDLPNLQLWLDSSVGITKDGSDFVSIWADQSGNGNDATQGVGARQPLWIDSTLNGLPVLDFATDFLTVGTQISKPANYTQIFVMSVDDITSNQRYSGSNDSGFTLATAWGVSGVKRIGGSADGSGLYIFGDGVNSSFGESSTAIFISNGTYAVIVERYESGDDEQTFRTGGGVIGTNTSATNATSLGGVNENYSIGRAGDFSGLDFNGTMAEHLLYSDALSVANIEKVENYLFNKYAL